MRGGQGRASLLSFLAARHGQPGQASTAAANWEPPPPFPLHSEQGERIRRRGVLGLSAGFQLGGTQRTPGGVLTGWGDFRTAPVSSVARRLMHVHDGLTDGKPTRFRATACLSSCLRWSKTRFGRATWFQRCQTSHYLSLALSVRQLFPRRLCCVHYSRADQHWAMRRFC
jgi:hypothetical protein